MSSSSYLTLTDRALEYILNCFLVALDSIVLYIISNTRLHQCRVGRHNLIETLGGKKILRDLVFNAQALWVSQKPTRSLVV